MEQLFNHPNLSGLWRMVHAAYKKPTNMFVKGPGGHVAAVIQSRNGARQGDPSGQTIFCVGVAPVYKEVKSRHPATDQTAVADDCNISGNFPDVANALIEMKDLGASIGLHLHMGKTHLENFNGTQMPSVVEATLNQHGIGASIDTPDHVLRTATTIFGTPFSPSLAVIRDRAIATARGKYDQFFNAINNPSLPNPVAASLLSQCGIHLLNHMMRNMLPEEIPAVLQDFDQKVSAARNRAARYSNGIDALAESRSKLPYRYGGNGLPCMAELAPIASFAARTENASIIAKALQSHPNLADSREIASTLSNQDTVMQRIRQIATDTHPEYIPPVEVPQGMPTLHWCAQRDSRKLQRKITGLLNAHDARNVLGNGPLSPFEVNLTAASKAKWAHAWRSTSGDSMLTDSEYSTAMHILAGKAPPLMLDNGLPSDRCTCRARPQFADEPFHWLACTSVMSGTVTRRHDAILDIILKWVEKLGGYAIKEPEGLSPHNQARPDGYFQFEIGGAAVILEVMVTNPLTPGHATVGSIQLGTAAQGENIKIARYNRQGLNNSPHTMGCTFIPFVVEATGGFGKSAVSLVNLIANKADFEINGYTTPEVRYKMTHEISNAIQKGNHAIMMAGKSIHIRKRMRRDIPTRRHITPGEDTNAPPYDWEGGEQETPAAAATCDRPVPTAIGTATDADATASPAETTESPTRPVQGPAPPRETDSSDTDTLTTPVTPPTGNPAAGGTSRPGPGPEPATERHQRPTGTDDAADRTDIPAETDATELETGIALESTPESGDRYGADPRASVPYSPADCPDPPRTPPNQPDAAAMSAHGTPPRESCPEEGFTESTRNPSGTACGQPPATPLTRLPPTLRRQAGDDDTSRAPTNRTHPGCQTTEDALRQALQTHNPNVVYPRDILLYWAAYLRHTPGVTPDAFVDGMARNGNLPSYGLQTTNDSPAAHNQPPAPVTPNSPPTNSQQPTPRTRQRARTIRRYVPPHQRQQRATRRTQPTPGITGDASPNRPTPTAHDHPTTSDRDTRPQPILCADTSPTLPMHEHVNTGASNRPSIGPSPVSQHSCAADRDDNNGGGNTGTTTNTAITGNAITNNNTNNSNHTHNQPSSDRTSRRRPQRDANQMRPLSGRQPPNRSHGAFFG